MLKKAGIIAAVATTGVLALSGIALADTVEGNIGNDCAFGNTTGENSQMLDGGSSLLGALGAVAGLITNTPAQTNTGNCTNLNVEDVLDFDSNNTTRERVETEIDDSFNTESADS